MRLRIPTTQLIIWRGSVYWGTGRVVSLEGEEARKIPPSPSAAYGDVWGAGGKKRRVDTHTRKASSVVP